MDLKVKVLSQEKTLFEGSAFAVSSFNEKGIFDVLPGHENFISIIKSSFTIHNKDGKDTYLPIEQGILKVYQNNVEVYIVAFPAGSGKSI